MPRVFSPEQLSKGLVGFGDKAREDLAGREQDIQRGKTVELLRRAGKEMYENPIVNTAVGLSPVLGDIQAGVEAYRSAQAGDWGNAGLNAAGMLPFIPMLGKTVWHGSPHAFDKFDMSKIGTGEGAQSYGHGLYLAEAQDVAKGYKEALSNPEVVLRSGERISNPAVGTNEDVAKAWLEEQFLKGSETPFDDAIARLNKLKGAANNPKQFEGAADVLNQWKNEGATVDLGGSLYRVDLPDEQIAKMLDWDKPLSEQPEIMQTLRNSEAFGPQSPSWAGAPEGLWEKNIGARTGSDFYLKNKWADDQAKGSAILYEAGIPGIQYLDQASRGAGDGTRNYVVFSDEIPQILERNGTPLGNALRKPQEMPISDLKLNEYGSAIAQSTFNKDKGYIHQNKNPISIVKLPNGEPYVLDGYHRIEQAKRAGQENIQVKELPLTDDIKQMLINDKVIGQE